MRGIRLILLTGLALGPVSAALASDQNGTTADQWKEEQSGASGIESATDAGKFPIDANLTRGAGPLNKITGTMSHTRDVDMYCITLTDPVNFSATVSGADNTLSLFDLQGHGIAFNDNNPAGGNGSRLTSLFTANIAPGTLVMLAIGRCDVGFGNSIYNYPMDVGNNPIFNTVPGTNRNVEYGPNDPNAVLDHWNYNSIGFELNNQNYNIALTGSGYHQLPAPGVSALLGLGGLLAARRKR